MVLAGRTSQALARLHYDIAPLLLPDSRVEIDYALIPGSRFEASAYRFAKSVGITLNSWATARTSGIDLVITSSPAPDLYESGAPSPS